MLGQRGGTEVRVIEGVESLGPEGEPDAFGELEALDDAEVKIPVTWILGDIGADADVARAGRAKALLSGKSTAPVMPVFSRIVAASVAIH